MIHKSACILVVLGLGCGVGGCGPPRAGPSDEVLIGAKFEIPVYPGARVISKKSMMFQKADESGDMQSFDNLTWLLQSSDPVERIVAYYELRLPDAKRTELGGDDGRAASEPGTGLQEFEYVPREAHAGDRVVITIGEEGLEIAQITLQK